MKTAAPFDVAIYKKGFWDRLTLNAGMYRLRGSELPEDTPEEHTLFVALSEFRQLTDKYHGANQAADDWAGRWDRENTSKKAAWHEVSEANKRVAELKQENASLTKQVAALVDRLSQNTVDAEEYRRILGVLNKREKENAELESPLRVEKQSRIDNEKEHK